MWDGSGSDRNPEILRAFSKRWFWRMYDLVDDENATAVVAKLQRFDFCRLTVDDLPVWSQWFGSLMKWLLDLVFPVFQFSLGLI